GIRHLDGRERKVRPCLAGWCTVLKPSEGQRCLAKGSSSESYRQPSAGYYRLRLRGDLGAQDNRQLCRGALHVPGGMADNADVRSRIVSHAVGDREGGIGGAGNAAIVNQSRALMLPLVSQGGGALGDYGERRGGTRADGLIGRL